MYVVIQPVQGEIVLVRAGTIHSTWASVRVRGFVRVAREQNARLETEKIIDVIAFKGQRLDLQRIERRTDGGITGVQHWRCGRYRNGLVGEDRHGHVDGRGLVDKQFSACGVLAETRHRDLDQVCAGCHL